MEIKYEAVFGDQSLFDGCIDEFAYLVIKTSYGQKFTATHETINGVIPDYIETCGLEIAMRRIIRTPTWTVADKKAGKLPEVGCRVFDVTNENEATVKAINKRQVCLESIDGFIYLLPPDDIKPIESTEEKAARLRKEWCVAASKQLKNLEYNRTLTSIYDALLSGDLPVPGREVI